MDQAQRNKGYTHDMVDNGLSDQLRWTMQKGGPMYIIRWGSLKWVTDQGGGGGSKRGATEKVSMLGEGS